ncbi:MAG: hypothetical protein Ct9H90mP3_2630 [Flammeovirgaceae bacterium]|nr:MAG: hypothetical protein Ct9H90mP3_2630 [Flammeovirgaceae bacterium]
MTPEISIKSQNKIGSDIAMIFDCLIDIKDSKEKQINSINLTRDWGSITKSFHKNKDQPFIWDCQGGFIKIYENYLQNIWLIRNMMDIPFGGVSYR